MALPKVGVEAVVDNANGYLKGIKSIIDANDSAADSVKGTAKQFDVLNDTTDYARSVQKRFASTLEESAAALAGGAGGAEGLVSALGGLAVGAGVVIVAFEAIKAAINAVGNIISGIIDIIGNVVKAMFDFGKTIVDSIGNALNFVKDIVVDIGKRLFDFGKVSVQAGMAFSKIMANISAVSGKTGVELRELTNDLINIGADAIAGPTAVADAYYDVASGITHANLSMAVLTASIKTAEAGQADLKATTNGMISVINAYDYGLQGIVETSNVFTQTVNKGKGTMNEFVAAMSPIATTAHSLNIGFTELGGAMAFMTQKGLTAGQAGTALQGIMTQLSRRTPGVTKALRAMGEQSVDTALANHGLAGTLALLQEGAKKTGQNLQTLVGRVEAMKAVTILGDEAFKDYFKTFMEGLDEATNKSREIQRLDVSAQWQLFQARLEGITLSISQAFLPAINKFLQFFNKSLAKIDWKKIGEGLQILGERIGESAAKLVDKLGSFLDTIDWNLLADQAMAFFDSIGNAIASIDWDKIIDDAGRFIGAVIDILSPIGELFTNINWEQFKNDAINTFNGVIQFIQSIDWKGIVQVVADLAKGIGDFVAGIDWSTIASNVGLIFTNITNASIKLGEFIESVDWAALGQKASEAITTITEAIAGIDWDKVVNDAIAFLQGASDFFASLNETVSRAGFLIQVVSDKVSNAFWAILNSALDVSIQIAGAINGIRDSIMKPLNDALKVINDVINAIRTLLGFNGSTVDLNIQSHVSGGGSSGTMPYARAKGGTLGEGLNIVGEKGAEAIVKSGSKAVVVSHDKTAGLLAGISKSTLAAMPGGASSGLAALNMAKSMLGYGSGRGAPIIAPIIEIPPMDFFKALQASGVMPGRWLAGGQAPARASAMPMPVYGGSGGGNTTVNNNRNIDTININGVRNGESAVQRFARLQAGRRRG